MVQELRRAVVRGTLRPGDKLTEVNLSTTLAVSRPIIREALNQLAQEGLLVQEPYRGLRVARLEPAQILDIARTRQALAMLARSDSARAGVMHHHLIEALLSRDRGRIEKAFQEHTIGSACELVSIIERGNEREDDT